MSTHSGRSGARLAAVQALYQMELAGAGADEVASEFCDHRFGLEPETGMAGEIDRDFFARVVHGVPEHQAEIDAAIAQVLSEAWRLSRIDSILRAILRGASFELIAAKDVPAKVVIDEYVGISHAFFSGDEPAFVNAALDRLAHRKRAAEFGETPPDDELAF
ncbi:MAG: transcription antitermination factor NusB [Alphaproteobacteria bacterium]|nr:transcription antitermination factor NusB [Alphaproteobacteria bacterium]MBV9693120.1 transcription antitermination factor NusB [Alphaproteobacteria bacterium]